MTADQLIDQPPMPTTGEHAQAWNPKAPSPAGLEDGREQLGRRLVSPRVQRQPATDQIPPTGVEAIIIPECVNQLNAAGEIELAQHPLNLIDQLGFQLEGNQQTLK